MDEYKFCIIICSNDELLLNESLHYIRHLTVPVGYEVELAVVKEAESMTRGYNEAMESSDAGYKIYMHQDVFILNKNILSDILEVFRSDPQIGMIGMVGYDRISPNGMMWQSSCRRGSIYGRQCSTELSDYRYSLTKDKYYYVAEVDGFFMATCQDLPWETKLLRGWDFYDAFQSINFLRHGYRIAVPIQRHPWCMHDDGKVLDMENYNYYRHIFMKTYGDYLGKHWSEIIV